MTEIFHLAISAVVFGALGYIFGDQVKASALKALPGAVASIQSDVTALKTAAGLK